MLETDVLDRYVDLSKSLPQLPSLSRRIRLSWNGGTYLDTTGDDDISGFLISGTLRIDSKPETTQIVAKIAAYPGNWIADGYGLGQFGGGGFGRSATTYTWTSDPLCGGSWTFAVASEDKEGNAGPVVLSVTQSIESPPLPPSGSSMGSALSYQYVGPVARVATLMWPQ